MAGIYPVERIVAGDDELPHGVVTGGTIALSRTRDSGHEIVAYTAGKMKKNRIKTLAGDRVTVEMSPYDLEKGRLIFRHKDERPASAGPGPQRGAQRGGQFRGRR